jgi:hypothetical protein
MGADQTAARVSFAIAALLYLVVNGPQVSRVCPRRGPP